MSRRGNIYLYNRGIVFKDGVILLTAIARHAIGGSYGLEHKSGSFCNPVYQALIRSEIHDSSVTILRRLILLKDSHHVAYP